MSNNYVDYEVGYEQYIKQRKVKKMSFNYTKFLWDQVKALSAYARGHNGEVDLGYSSMCKLDNTGVTKDLQDEATQILINPPKVDIEPILQKYWAQTEDYINKFREEIKRLIKDEIAKASVLNYTSPLPTPIEQTPTPPPVPKEMPLPDEIEQGDIDALLLRYKKQLSEKSEKE